jgi:hypothetical protein
MQFTWQPKSVIGKLIVGLLIAAPFGYFGLSLLGDPRARLMGWLFLGIAVLLIALFVWQLLRLLAQSIRPQPKERPQAPVQPTRRPPLLTSFQQVALVSVVVFLAPALWLIFQGRWGEAMIWGSIGATTLAMGSLPQGRREPLFTTHPYRVALVVASFGVTASMFGITGDPRPVLLGGAILLGAGAMVAYTIAAQRLGRRMRAPLATPVAAAPSGEMQAPLPASGPHPPLAEYDLVHPPPIAEAARELIALRLQSVGTSALVYRRAASLLWFWLAGMLLFVLLGNGSLQPYDGGLFLIGCIYHLLSLWRPKEQIQQQVWMASCYLLSAWWLFSVVFVAAFVGLRLLFAVGDAWGMVSAALAGNPPPSTTQPLGLGWAVFTNGVALALGIAGLLLYRRKIGREGAEHALRLQTNRPLKLLFLWVFGSDAVMETLLSKVGGQWSWLGSMQVLCGRGYMGMLNELLPGLVNARRDPLVESPDELQARLAAFNHAPKWNRHYATNSLLCHDSVWREALAALLADNQVVLMSLGGFSAENSGCVYEISRLVDRVPTERFLLLVDEHTDREALRRTLETAWTGMASDSPNRATGAEIRLYHTRWFGVKPLRGDPEHPLTAEQQAFENLRAQSVASEIEHVVGLLCSGAVAPQFEHGPGQPSALSNQSSGSTAS